MGLPWACTHAKTHGRATSVLAWRRRRLCLTFAAACAFTCAAEQMAVVAQIKDVAIHVYEKERAAAGSFRRIATFGAPDNEDEAHILYGGRVHYDALQIFH